MFDSQFSHPLDAAEILNFSKALEPLDEASIAELRRIEALSKLGTYSEQDVREDIVTPILRAMGYQKETIFSVDREKSIWIADKRLAVDYNLTLWEENFWVIEAKKPGVTRGRFGYDAVWQAVQYAIHPEINAALVVLCDGHAIEVFDRDDDLRSPVLRVERANLVRDFDKLRAFLGPLQAWFFEKRRIVRLIDKVFDREFNLGRAEDFRKLIERRLKSKEQRILDNMRALPRPDTPEQTDQMLRETDTPELIEHWLWLEMSWRNMRTIARELVERSRENLFPICHRIFPDHPRAANHAFHVNALLYLIEMDTAGIEPSWLPDWLVGGSGKRSAADAVERLIAHCLTFFSTDRPRRAVLLHAAATRRLAKAIIVLAPDAVKAGRMRHLLERYWGEEFGFSQMVSSPKRHLVLEIERLERLASHHFVDSVQEDRSFALLSAERELRRTWAGELRLLQSERDYRALLAERDLGETFPTEANCVVSDQLAHGTLCILDQFPRWREHCLATHRVEVEEAAGLGSWQARKWLGIPIEGAPRASEQDLANRFFLGELETAHALIACYGYTSV